MKLAVPRCPPRRLRALPHPPMGEERDEREQTQKRGRRPPDGQLGPLSLRLDSQMPPRLLESRLHLPAQDEPAQEICAGSAMRSVQRRACGANSSCASRSRTQRRGTGGSPVWYQSAVAEATSRDGALPLAVPVGYRDGRPDGARSVRHRGQGGQALAFEALPAYLFGFAWRSRLLVERRVQAQARDEGERLFWQEASAARKRSLMQAA